MSVRYLVNWAIWIGVLSGFYVYLYLQTPLAPYGIIWMTFVALPIYFTGGAKPEEYLSYVLSMLVGVIWGLFYLFCIDRLIAWGMAGDLATALVVAVVCSVQCAVHFIPPLSKTPLRVVPIMFGAISMCFSQGGEKAVPVALTLLGGLTLALCCGLGVRFLTPEGRWSVSGVFSGRNATGKS
ncbi:MAG: DUF1097 domain-containing protein [Deltaproteobacteria bacterium]|jgi:hypothetical protein|nr:DUF1097 domain-containing protein [Deltaproteobacteria bacterium]